MSPQSKHRSEPPEPDTETIGLKPGKPRKRLLALLGTLATVAIAVPICWGWIARGVEIVKAPETLAQQAIQINAIQQEVQLRKEWQAQADVRLKMIEEQVREVKTILNRMDERMRYPTTQSPKLKDQSTATP